MNDRIKPIIDSTYPALMAGLCLTFLSISPNDLKSTWLVSLVSTASLFFIISSVYVFVYSVNIGWGKKTKEKKSSKDDKPISWNIAKWSYFIGIVLLLLSTLIIVYNLWLYDFLQSNLTELFNSINVTETNNT